MDNFAWILFGIALAGWLSVLLLTFCLVHADRQYRHVRGLYLAESTGRRVDLHYHEKAVEALETERRRLGERLSAAMAEISLSNDRLVWVRKAASGGFAGVEK